MHAIAHGGCTDTHRSLPWNLTLGEKSIAASGNRTCVSSVPIRCSINWATSQLKFTITETSTAALLHWKIIRIHAPWGYNIKVIGVYASHLSSHFTLNVRSIANESLIDWLSSCNCEVCYFFKLVLWVHSTTKDSIRAENKFNLSPSYSLHMPLDLKYLFLKLQLKSHPQFRNENPEKQ